MISPMIPVTNEAAKLRLITCFAQALQQSLSLVRGGPWVCVPSSVADAVGELRVAPSGLTTSLCLRGTLHGKLTLGLRPDQAQTLFSEGNPEGEWHAVMRGLLQYLPKRSRDAGIFEFCVDSHELVEGSVEHARIAAVEVSGSTTTRVFVDVQADEELLSSLQVAEWNASTEAARAQRDSIRSAQLGRVMDVPLAVTLRFGQRQMRLRDVLELDTGVLVELDRQVEEPVDLMLGNRVIARGEVVIVDGNYGLRVTEIVERDAVAGEVPIGGSDRNSGAEAYHATRAASFVA